MRKCCFFDATSKIRDVVSLRDIMKQIFKDAYHHTKLLSDVSSLVANRSNSAQPKFELCDGGDGAIDVRVVTTFQVLVVLGLREPAR